MLKVEVVLLLNDIYTYVVVFFTSHSPKILINILQYYNRWANHEQSAKLSLDLYVKTEKKMEDMQITSSLTWIEVSVHVCVMNRMDTSESAIFIGPIHEKGRRGSGKMSYDA
jgi:hypothetical protein